MVDPLFLVLAALAGGAPPPDDYAERRRAMVQQVVAYPTPTGPIDRAVLQALQQVPRHRFVPPEWQERAYEDRPLPIGHGQTISQPYVVALMTDLLGVRRWHRVLEVGTGSGYQAAILARLAKEVFTIEIVESLAKESGERLAALGYANVKVRAGDGYAGWPEEAPFDAIMVTAGAEDVPPPLLAQLRPGGRMVIPVGPAEGIQSLLVVEKRADGSASRREVIPVRFVPFTRAPERR